MAHPVSYYFTLFKKFQVLGRVPFAQAHGRSNPSGGFDLKKPGPAFVPLLPGTRGKPIDVTNSDEQQCPLWKILAARTTDFDVPMGMSTKMPAGFLDPVLVNGETWFAMPKDLSSKGWGTFQVNPQRSAKLLERFKDWINGVRLDDSMADALAENQSPFIGSDPGTNLFVCSKPGDQGARPAALPNYWASSLIELISPSTGEIATPPTLTAGADYFLAAVIGNRGMVNAGAYSSTPGNPPPVQVKAAAMVWTTSFSPGVELPSLSSLDPAAPTMPPNGTNGPSGTYEQYFLNSGRYDVAGFHFPVQTVFDGIVKAVFDAVKNGSLSLPGLPANPTDQQIESASKDWVLQQPAHLCVKVAIRELGTNGYPAPDESPEQNGRIAQKNLAPFAASLTPSPQAPNINWKNFIAGQPIFLKLRAAGRNRLLLRTDLPRRAVQLFLAVPKAVFERHFAGEAGKGFRVATLRDVPERDRPFRDAVVLRAEGDGTHVDFGPLPEGNMIGLALGLRYDPKALKDGDTGDIHLIQETMLPRIDERKRSFTIRRTRVGGFTLRFRAFDPRRSARSSSNRK